MNYSTSNMRVLWIAVVILMMAFGAITFFAATPPSLLQGVHAAPPPPKQIVATAVLPEALPTATPQPMLDQEAPALATGWNTLMTEDFEGAFPGSGWELYSGGDPAYEWGKRNCQAHGGSYSASGHGGGSGGGSLPCGSDYPPDVESWLIYGPFSLANATAAELTFWYRNDSETDYDFFYWEASTDGQHFSGWKISGDSNGWQQMTFDLSNVPTLGNLLGQDNVWITFIFISDSSLGYEGAYVDDVTLRAQMSGGATRTPTVTTTTSPTRTPTVTTTPDTSPLHFQAFLPLVRTNHNIASVSEEIASNEQGTIENSAGVKLSVPMYAVPVGDNGENRSVTFSIEQASIVPTPPPGETLIGDVFRFGPDGFVFANPLKLTLPVPRDLHIPPHIYRIDPTTNQLERFPATYDPTAGTITAMSPSLSPWFPASSPNPTGAIRLINDTGDYWINICVDRYQLTSPPVGYVFYEGPGGGAAPRGTIGWSSEPAIMYDQGTYKFCVEWRKRGTPLTLPGPPVHRFTGNIRVDKPYVWPDYETSAELRYSNPAGEIGGPCPCVPRPMWGGGTGDVQITLTWYNGSSVDLDLHVWDPQGNHIYYGNKTPPTGGSLDVDNKCSNYVNGRPENVVWPASSAPSGVYTVKVAFYDNCGNAIEAQAYSLRVIAKGVAPMTYSGTVTTDDDDDHPKLVATFTVP